MKKESGGDAKTRYLHLGARFLAHTINSEQKKGGAKGKQKSERRGHFWELTLLNRKKKRSTGGGELGKAFPKNTRYGGKGRKHPKNHMTFD